MRDRIPLWLATGFGLGYSPWIPGTVGSLPGFALVYLQTQWQNPWLTFLWLSGLFLLGVWICNLALPHFPTKDPRAITIDEIVSLPVTFWGIPLGASTLITGFVLNRILDILKPPPARQLENLPGGVGIMADDIASAIYANLLLRLLLPFLP